MTEREELKPCSEPKCDGVGLVMSYDGGFIVYCDVCDMEVFAFTEAEAISAWNRRAER